MNPNRPAPPGGFPTEMFNLDEPPPATIKVNGRPVARSAPQERRGPPPPQARPARPKRGGIVAWVGRRIEGFSSGLFVLGAFLAAGVVDTVEVYWGMEALSAMRADWTGAGLLPLWFVGGATALIFMLGNGSQWKTAANWDDWRRDPRTLIKQVPFLLMTALLAGVQVGFAGLGGYAFFGGTPASLTEMVTPGGLLSLGVSAFFSLGLQFVATLRLVRSVTPKE